MTSADASKKGSKPDKDDPRIQPLSAKHAEELREKFKSHESDAVEQAIAYAKKEIIDLELWSWVDVHLPDKVKEMRQKAEAALYEDFMEEFFKGWTVQI